MLKHHKLIILIGISIFAVTALLVWEIPLAPIPAKTSLGCVNLESEGEKIEVNIVPFKTITNITLVFEKPITESNNYCASPSFDLKIFLKISDQNNKIVLKKVIDKNCMKWTNWDNGPSLMLETGDWLGNQIEPNMTHHLSLSVEKSSSGIGKGTFYLHWMNLAYLWGTKKENPKITNNLCE